jgi:DNA-binding NtrC family response regulator
MKIESSGKADPVQQQTSENNEMPKDERGMGLNRSALEGAAQTAQQFLAHSQSQISSQLSFEEQPFIGASPSIKKIFELVNKVANTDSTVLILGESGTGKELIARSLHYRSQRRNKPFVPVNCGAIPSELLESELFGHMKGSFTGAHANRIGRFSLAHQGTLFLDEIGTMPASLQVKILRALQQKEFEPVGGTKTLKSDCRVIAATNDDLEAEVARGNFREDLFYRLNVIPISLPPLRERKEDVELLVKHFMKSFNEKKGYDVTGISDEALSLLMRYNWPGNVRELENIVQRVCILKGEGLIEREDLPTKIMEPKPIGQGQKPWSTLLADAIPESGIPFDQLVLQFENDLILKALEQTRWNKNRAAHLLQLNRTTLVEKIKKRGLVQSFDDDLR